MKKIRMYVATKEGVKESEKVYGLKTFYIPNVRCKNCIYTTDNHGRETVEKYCETHQKEFDAISE